MSDTSGWLNLASLIRPTRIGEALRNVGYSIGGIYGATQQRSIPRSVRLSVKLAGLSGASAVGLGYYGFQVFNSEEADKSLRERFLLGNGFHFVHTIGLLASPMSSYPGLVGFLMGTGVLLFSGSCYCQTLYQVEDADLAKRVEYASYVGLVVLCMAWISMVL